MKRLMAAVVVLGLVGCSGGTAASDEATTSASPETSEQPPSTAAASASAAGEESPAATANGAAYQACELLTDDEIEQLTGFPVVESQAGYVMGIAQDGCNWELDSGQLNVAWEVEVGVISPGGRAYYDTYMAPYVGEPIGGLGDDAVIGDVNDITAVKGDTLVFVEFITFGVDDELEITKNLTQRVLDKVS